MAGRPDVSLLSTGHDVADARMHREVAALQRAGLTVEVLALGDSAAGPPDASVRTRARRGLGVRAVRAALLPWSARGRVLLTFDPDLVPSASLRARLFRRALVVDVHEDFLALLRDRAWAHGAAGRLAGGLVRAATALSRRADLTVVADEHVRPAAARDRLVLRNLPDPSMLPSPGPLDPTPRAIYVGDLRRSRGLFTMIEAVRAAPGWRLDLVGPVAPGDEPRLRTKLADDPELAGRVRLHGRLEPRASWELARGAWAGLVLLEPTRAFESAMPTKVYEYLACGLPVLCTPLPRPAELLRDSGAGRVVSDAQEAAAVLREWATDPADVAALGERGRSWWASSGGESGYAAFAARVVALAGRGPVAGPPG